jgi:hypothetical protein
VPPGFDDGTLIFHSGLVKNLQKISLY